MHRCFYKADLAEGETIYVDGEEAIHMLRVLRLTKGDFVEITSANGKVFSGEIISEDKKTLEILVGKEMEENFEPSKNVKLFIGLTKSAKLELVIQKAVELGISEIYPVAMQRSVVKAKEEDKKTDRFRKIALEAVKQCKRNKIPFVSQPVDFKKAIELLKECDISFAPYEGEKQVSLKSVLGSKECNSIGYIIGPEGGFSLEEIEFIKKNNIPSVTLGSRILRMETAAISVLGIVMYEMGEMDRFN
jgi:16S rRNA (uracil1498-N3)-methyltransferase